MSSCATISYGLRPLYNVCLSNSSFFTTESKIFLIDHYNYNRKTIKTLPDLLNETLHKTNNTPISVESDNEYIPKTIKEKIDYLKSFSSLPINWNGYGANPICQPIIDLSLKVLLSLKCMPKIFPTGLGTIQFEFEKENGDYLEIEVNNTESISTLHEKNNGNYDEKDWTVSEETIFNIARMVDVFCV